MPSYKEKLMSMYHATAKQADLYIYLEKVKTNTKECSAAALLEIVLILQMLGNLYEDANGIGHQFWLIYLRIAEDKGIHRGGVDDAVRHLLHGGQNRAAIMRVKDEIEKFGRNIEYDEFDRRHLKISITSDARKGAELLKSMKEGFNKYPIYMDCEGTLLKTASGLKTALMIFFDVRTRHVVLWRIHKIRRDELDIVREAFMDLAANNRKFMSFGTEDIFAELQLYSISAENIQSEWQRPSLKNTVWAISSGEFNLIKTETMSDWCNPRLRKDQVYYAAMDAVSVHYIHVSNVVNWSRFRNRGTNSGFSYCSPTTQIEHSRPWPRHSYSSPSSPSPSPSSPMDFCSMENTYHYYYSYTTTTKTCGAAQK